MRCSLVVTASISVDAKSGVLIPASFGTIESRGRQGESALLNYKRPENVPNFFTYLCKKDAFECRLWSADCGILRPAGGDGVHSAGV